MNGITKENLESLTKDDLIGLCLAIVNSTDIRVRGLNGYAKQVRDMAEFLNEQSLVEDIDDAKDKTWDRGHKIMENFDKYLTKLGEMEEMFLPAKKDNLLIEKAAKKSVLSISRGE